MRSFEGKYLNLILNIKNQRNVNIELEEDRILVIIF